MDAPDLSQVEMPQQDAPDLSGPGFSGESAPTNSLAAPDLSQMALPNAPDLSNPDYSNEGRQPPVSEDLIPHAQRLFNNAQQASLDYTKGLENTMDTAGAAIAKDPTGTFAGAAAMVPAMAAFPSQVVNTVGSAIGMGAGMLATGDTSGSLQAQQDIQARNQKLGGLFNDLWDKVLPSSMTGPAKVSAASQATQTLLALPFTEPEKAIIEAATALKAKDPQLTGELVTTALFGLLPTLAPAVRPILGKAVDLIKPSPKVDALRQDILDEVQKTTPTDVVPTTLAVEPPVEPVKPVSETVQAAADLAPVDPGYVRVFRGQDPDRSPPPPGSNVRAWFTTDPDLASGYGKQVNYVDVPEDIYKEAAAQTGEAGVRLGPEWVNQAKPLAKGEALPTYEVTEEPASVRPPQEVAALKPDYSALGRATKQGGAIDPSTTMDGWVQDLAAKMKASGFAPHQVADAILNKFVGTFHPEAIKAMKLLGTGDSTKEGSTRPTLMTQNQYLQMTSKQDLGFSSEASAKYAKISEALRSQLGLNDIPKLVVDKVGDNWQVVDHDGRHRAEMLQKNGQYGMPVRIEDRTYGDFNRENPKTILTQQGEEVATPRSLYPDQPTVKRNPFAGPGGKQGGAFDLSAFTPKEQEQYRKAIPILGRSAMTADEFKAMHPNQGPDMKSRIGAGDGSFRTHTELEQNRDDPSHASHVAAHIDDQMHLAKEVYERQIIEKVLPQWNTFRSRYQTRLFPSEAYAGFLPFYKTFVKDIKIAVDLEKHPEKWFDGTKYSPTTDQLTKLGMDPKSAQAFSSLYQGWENVWPDMEDFAKQRGMDIPARIPGYLPHFTQGAWVVRLFRDMPDGSREYAASVGAKDPAQANEFKTALDRHVQGKGGYTSVIEPPSIHNDLATMIHGIFEVKDKIGQDKALTGLLQRLYEQSSMGYLQGALERAKNPQYLHQLDRIGTGDTFQLTPRETFNAMGKMQTLMEAIPAMKMRGDFCRNTLFPLEAGGYFENRPNLSAAVQEYVKQFMHIPDTASGHIDNFVKDFFLRGGKDPDIPIRWVQSANNGMAMFYLFYSPKFWLNGQLTQKMLGSSIIWNAKADALSMHIPGAERASVPKALLQDLAYSSKQIKLSSGESLYDYAMKTGHAEATFVESLDSSHVFNDPIAKWIESYTRQGGFRLGYLFYRQFMTESDALNAAGRFTDKVNVPYSGDLGKPFIFAKEGALLKPTTTFMQYWMHSLQNISSQMTSLTNSLGNPRATANAAMGLAHTFAAQVAVGGIRGLPFILTATAIINYINQQFSTNYPTPVEWTRKLGDVMRNTNWGSPYANLVAKIGEFGATSTALGYDMSGSGSGPNVSPPGTVFLHFLNTLGSAAIMAGQWAFKPGGVTKPEMMDAAEQAPPPIRGTLEYMIRDKTLNEVVQYMTGKQQDQAPMRYQPMEPGNYERTQLDSILALAGLKSVGEAAQNTTMGIDARAMKVEKGATETIIQNIMDNPSSSKTAEGLVYLAQKYQVDPQTILDMIGKGQEERAMTEDQRRAVALDPSNPTSTAHMLRWLEEQRLTPH